MKTERKLFEESIKRFDIELNPYYVSVPSRVSKDRRHHASDPENKSSPTINPVTFITRISDDYEDFPEQLIAKTPYFTFVIGQYGLGKTELISQICRFVLKSEEYANYELVPLPVALVNCRKYIKDKNLSFGEFLFNDILSDIGIRYSSIEDKILKDISSGRIILLLDGLDELLQLENRSIELHKWFLNSLAQFIASSRKFSSNKEPRFKVVVSMREEYLSVVTSTDAKSFRRVISPYFENINFSLYFLNLTFFDESRIFAYLLKRNQTNEDKDYNLIEELGKNPNFREIFHRPLLLRLLVDWLEYETADLADLVKELSEHNHTAYFIRYYISTIVNDNKLKHVQDQILKCDWDPKLIALRCLLMSEEGRQIMELDDVRNILVSKNTNPIEELSDEQVLAGIHKCPFLKKELRRKGNDQKIVFCFAHKIFFEYFTVEGVLLDLQEGKAKNGFGAFDELVLNVDMRKFLKAFVGGNWYHRTAIAYALGEKDWPEWEFEEVCKGNPVKIRNYKVRNRLDNQRKLLLDTMSEPEIERKGTKTTILNFLAEEIFYHPRYLVPNYEAISVFIWNNIWSEEGKSLYTQFEKIAYNRTKFIIEGLTKNNLKLSKEWLLLLERISDIGYRMRFPWIRQLIDQDRVEIKKLLNNLKDSNPESSDIIERILVNIKNILSAEIWEEKKYDY